MSSSVTARVVVDWEKIEAERRAAERRDAEEKARREEERARREAAEAVILDRQSDGIAREFLKLRPELQGNRSAPQVPDALMQGRSTSLSAAKDRFNRLTQALDAARIAIGNDILRKSLDACLQAWAPDAAARPGRPQQAPAANQRDADAREQIRAGIEALRPAMLAPGLAALFDGFVERIGQAPHLAAMQIALTDLSVRVQQANAAWKADLARRDKARAAVASLVAAGEPPDAGELQSLTAALASVAVPLDPETLTRAERRLTLLRQQLAVGHAARVITEELAKLGYAVPPDLPAALARDGRVEVKHADLGPCGLEISVRDADALRFELQRDGDGIAGPAALDEDRRLQEVMCDHLGHALHAARQRGVMPGVKVTPAGSHPVRRRPQRAVRAEEAVARARPPR